MSALKRLTAAAVLGVLVGAVPVVSAGAAVPVAGATGAGAFPGVALGPTNDCALSTPRSVAAGDQSLAGPPALFFRRPGAPGITPRGPCLPNPFPR